MSASSIIPQHIITITGGSGSGKSTLTRMIKERAGEDNVLHIEHDMYYKPAAQLAHHGEFINYDTPRALNNELLVQHLQALMRGESVQLPHYDFGPDGQSTPGPVVEPRKIIVVEGIFLLAIPELRKSASIDLFVDVDGEVRLARRIIRDLLRGERSDMGKPGYEDDLMYYLDYVKKGFDHYVLPHRKHADLVLDNNSHTTEPMVKRALEFLQSRQILA